MEEKTTEQIDVVFKILFGIIGSLIIGYIFFQQKIFNFHNIFFAFIIWGIYGSVFLGLLPKFKIGKQLLVLIAVVFINIIIMGKPNYFSFIIRDSVIILSIFLSMKTYIFFIKKNKSLPLFIRTFGLPVIFASINIAGIFLLVLISGIFEGFNFSYIPRILLINAELAGLVGIGLGLGFDLWEYIKLKFLKEKIVKTV